MAHFLFLSITVSVFNTCEGYRLYSTVQIHLHQFRLILEMLDIFSLAGLICVMNEFLSLAKKEVVFIWQPQSESSSSDWHSDYYCCQFAQKEETGKLISRFKTRISTVKQLCLLQTLISVFTTNLQQQMFWSWIMFFFYQHNELDVLMNVSAMSQNKNTSLKRQIKLDFFW